MLFWNGSFKFNSNTSDKWKKPKSKLNERMNVIFAFFTRIDQAKWRARDWMNECESEWWYRERGGEREHIWVWVSKCFKTVHNNNSNNKNKTNSKDRHFAFDQFSWWWWCCAELSLVQPQNKFNEFGKSFGVLTWKLCVKFSCLRFKSRSFLVFVCVCPVGSYPANQRHIFQYSANRNSTYRIHLVIFQILDIFIIFIGDFHRAIFKIALSYFRVRPA